MPEIVIQFSRAAPVGFFDRWIKNRSLCICRLTHSPFSHVDYVLRDWKIHRGLSLLGASNNPKAPYVEGNPCGVAIRPWNYQPFAIRKWAVIPCTQREKDDFNSFVLAQIGRPFDSGALKLRTFLSSRFEGRDWRADDRWFCAELLARAIEISRMLRYEIAFVKNRVTPADLLLMISPRIDVEAFWSLDKFA